MSTVIIAEKTQAAEAIADALGKVIIEKRGLIKIFTIPSRNITVIPLRGHIVGHEPVAKFENWSKSDPREIITDAASLEKKPITGMQGYVHVLHEFGKRASTCVIGTDADVEGCAIGLKDALPFIQDVNPRVRVMQLWISSLQPKDVQRGFANLILPKYSWGDAGEARGIIDGIIGFSATREVSMTLRPVVRRYGAKVASIGRVQTCLLYLIYKREVEIRTFVPSPYWTLSAIINLQGTLISALHEKSPFKNAAEANQIYQKVVGEKTALLYGLQTQVIENKPPTPLNTTKALVLITRHAGISAPVALKTMEELYLDQLISYPRTDSDVYPKDFDHSSNLRQFTNHSHYGAFSSKILQQQTLAPTRGRSDAGDHIPITPIASVELTHSKLNSPIKKKVYDLLTRHYIALFYPPAKEMKAGLTFNIASETFLAHNLDCISRGYLDVLPEFAPKYVILPSITQGANYPVKEIKKEEKKTTPPSRYNDTTLIQLMEKKKIGTKSTRPTMIQILLDRQYAQREKKQVQITQYGYELMANLEKIWVTFLEPSFTGHVEEKLDAVLEGKVLSKTVIDEIRGEFLTIFDAFRTNKATIAQAMQALPVQTNSTTMGKAKSPKREQFSLSNCPFCGKTPMKVISTQKSTHFLVCVAETCKKTLALPKKGRIQFLNTKCQICGFCPVAIKASKNKRSFTYNLCPNCWTRTLQEQDETKKQGFCKKCQTGKIVDNVCQPTGPK